MEIEHLQRFQSRNHSLKKKSNELLKNCTLRNVPKIPSVCSVIELSYLVDSYTMNVVFHSLYFVLHIHDIMISPTDCQNKNKNYRIQETYQKHVSKILLVC